MMPNADVRFSAPKYFFSVQIGPKVNFTFSCGPVRAPNPDRFPTCAGQREERGRGTRGKGMFYMDFYVLWAQTGQMRNMAYRNFAFLERLFCGRAVQIQNLWRENTRVAHSKCLLFLFLFSPSCVFFALPWLLLFVDPRLSTLPDSEDFQSLYCRPPTGKPLQTVG